MTLTNSESRGALTLLLYIGLLTPNQDNQNERV